MSVEPLVTTSWLNEQMKSKDWKEKFCLLDTTWDLPSSKRNFVEEYNQCHIPGAQYFSLSECRNKEASLPNTIPTQEHFEKYVSSLGVSNDHHVILYDNSERFGLFSAPRTFWLFQVFGHSNVSIVDGGLPKWKKEELPTESGEQNSCQVTEFKATYHPELFRDLAFAKSNMESEQAIQVADARPEGRFRGVQPEPRPDIPSGHIPKSLCVPFFGCFDGQKNVMLSKEGVNEYLKVQKLDVNKDLFVSCGSGVTACVLAFAIYYATNKKVPVFDGSWFDWQLNTPNNETWQIREEINNEGNLITF